MPAPRANSSPSATADTRFSDALNPVVEAALKRSVRDEPAAWAEALFPVLMPAIRLAITGALQSMVETLNQVLEHSLSIRSWRWRVEAWRTGKSFAEVVLARTLVWRVEQVLLVHRQTGLLVIGAAAPNTATKDPDLISAMLTAIQRFIQESFQVDPGAGISELRVGDFSLWVEQGPSAALAAAVRGQAPFELRETLRAAVDLAHQEYGKELHDFNGDSRPLQRANTILEGCLQSRYLPPQKASYRKLWIATATLLALLLGWTGYRVYQSWRFSRALAALRSTSGIALTSQGREGGRYFIEGLRDPLAAAPERVVERSGLDPRRVELRFKPYLSLEPALAARHALEALDAPPTVTATMSEGVLTVSGRAEREWIALLGSSPGALALAGVREVRAAGLLEAGIDRLRQQIEAERIQFHQSNTVVEPDQVGRVRALAARAARWTSALAGSGAHPRVTVLGYADSTGTEQENLAISLRRAQAVAEYLRAAGVPPASLGIKGEGVKPAPGAGGPEAQRSVVIRLIADAAGGDKAR